MQLMIDTTSTAMSRESKCFARQIHDSFHCSPILCTLILMVIDCCSVSSLPGSHKQFMTPSRGWAHPMRTCFSHFFMCSAMITAEHNKLKDLLENCITTVVNPAFQYLTPLLKNTKCELHIILNAIQVD